MWTATLANILIASAHRWGETWGWRIANLVHAIPFLALAFGFGWVNGYLWDVSPMIQGCLCFGFVATGMAVSWFKEWRRGY